MGIELGFLFYYDLYQFIINIVDLAVMFDDVVVFRTDDISLMLSGPFDYPDIGEEYIARLCCGQDLTKNE